MTEFLADGPDWHLWSWTGVWFSSFSAGDEWIGSDIWEELHGFKVLKETRLDLQKRFPIYHAVPKCLAAHICGSAFPENGSAFLQELDEVGKIHFDWQRGNVHCVLIQHLEILSNHSYDSLISFCNSCILPVSIWIFDQFFLAIVSNVELWNFFNSSISLRLFSWASRRSQFCFNNCSSRSWWSCWRCSSAWALWISSFCDSIVSFNFCILFRS